MIRQPALLLSVLFALGCVHASAAQPAPRPNVLFIAVDDLRDWMNYLGQAQVRTPNFDRLARMGVSFTRSHAISTVCNPSRASTLLGLRPGATGIYGNTTDWRKVARGVVTLPRHFKDNGYTVLGTGKISHDEWQQPEDWTKFHQSPTVGNWQQRTLERGGKLPDGAFYTAFRVGRNVVTPLDAPDADLSAHANTSWAIAQLQRARSCRG